MIYSVNGTLIHTEPGAAVVECGGVGFKCLTSMGTLRTLPAPGAQVKLYTKLNVREDAMDLFGFATLAELNCFQLLKMCIRDRCCACSRLRRRSACDG